MNFLRISNIIALFSSMVGCSFLIPSNKYAEVLSHIKSVAVANVDLDLSKGRLQIDFVENHFMGLDNIVIMDAGPGDYRTHGYYMSIYNSKYSDYDALLTIRKRHASTSETKQSIDDVQFDLYVKINRNFRVYAYYFFPTEKYDNKSKEFSTFLKGLRSGHGYILNQYENIGIIY